MIYHPWSKSGVSTIRMCPAKADLHKNKGIKSLPNIYAKKGWDVHRMKEMIDTGVISVNEVPHHTDDPDVINWTELAVKHDPYHGYQNRVCETHVYVDADGYWVETEDQATAHGILDDVVFPDEEILDVIDLKSGVSVYDDIIERHLYAGVLAKAAQPDYDRIRFTRFYCRTGKRPSWLYEWKKTKSGTSLYVTNPKGERKQIRHKHPVNPLVIWMQNITKEIEKTEPKPRPGSHCRNWFGAPCQFLGNLCPLSDQIPDIVPLKPVMDSEQKTAFLNFFRAREASDCLGISPQEAALAYDAVLQLEAGIKEVEKKLKVWSENNGPINLNNESYGWHERTEWIVNKADALKILYDAGLHWEEIAKAVNISKSSIDKLPKNLQSIKTLLQQSVRQASKNRFGLIPDIKQEEDFA